MLILGLAGIGSVLAGAEAGAAQARLTQEEALRMAFPEADTVERRTAYLEEDEMARVAELAGDGRDSRRSVVTYYVGRSDTVDHGVAYFDAHRVRTKREVLMVVVVPDGEVERVEVLRFDEPREYLPPDGWLAQFEGRELDRSLSTRGEIVNITGATLTSRAVTGAVRRALALHRVIRPLEREGGGGGE